jgi:hypothetical protein
MRLPLGLSFKFRRLISKGKYAAAQLQAKLRRSRKLRRYIRHSSMLREAKKLLNDPQYGAFREEVVRYWRHHLGRDITPIWHLAFAKITGKQDVRFIPGQVWNDQVLPFLNDLSLRPAFLDKNLSDIFLDAGRTPATILKRMHGNYYKGTTQLTRQDAVSHLTSFGGKRFIIKGSRTDNGLGIRMLEIAGEKFLVNGEERQIADLEDLYGNNFLVQEMIVQHQDLAKIHPQSVNTIRVVTLRWREEITVLMSIARFGIGGGLNDNLGSGGIACGIDSDGRLMDRAFDIEGNVYSEHPTTGFRFENRASVPSHDRACEFARDLHRQIFHFDIVSWDIAIARDGAPIFLEVNFRGGCDSYQIVVGRPLFGNLTEEILHAVRDSQNGPSGLTQSLRTPA